MGSGPFLLFGKRRNSQHFFFFFFCLGEREKKNIYSTTASHTVAKSGGNILVKRGPESVCVCRQATTIELSKMAVDCAYERLALEGFGIKWDYLVSFFPFLFSGVYYRHTHTHTQRKRQSIRLVVVVVVVVYIQAGIFKNHLEILFLFGDIPDSLPNAKNKTRQFSRTKIKTDFSIETTAQLMNEKCESPRGY